MLKLDYLASTNKKKLVRRRLVKESTAATWIPVAPVIPNKPVWTILSYRGKSQSKVIQCTNKGVVATGSTRCASFHRPIIRRWGLVRLLNPDMYARAERGSLGPSHIPNDPNGYTTSAATPSSEGPIGVVWVAHYSGNPKHQLQHMPWFIIVFSVLTSPTRQAWPHANWRTAHNQRKSHDFNFNRCA